MSKSKGRFYTILKKRIMKLKPFKLVSKTKRKSLNNLKGMIIAILI